VKSALLCALRTPKVNGERRTVNGERRTDALTLAGWILLYLIAAFDVERIDRKRVL